MPVGIFNYLDYKVYIQDEVKDRGSPWGYWGEMATQMKCQPAYLSRCMKDSTHLTIDQILLLSRFWSLGQTETEYLVFLLELARAGNEESKKYFHKKLIHIKKENENIKSRLKKDAFKNTEAEAIYYSNWLWMAVHFATSIESLQSVEALSKRFFAPPEQILTILERLQQMGLVVKKNSRWIFQDGEFHLGKESSLLPVHHQNWRVRAVQDAQNLASEGVHFTAVYTLSKNDYEKLKQKSLKWIEDNQLLVSKSPEEEIVCFSIDVFSL